MLCKPRQFIWVLNIWTSYVCILLLAWIAKLEHVWTIHDLISLKKACKVTHCAGRISVNTRPHQLHVLGWPGDMYRRLQYGITLLTIIHTASNDSCGGSIFAFQSVVSWGFPHWINFKKKSRPPASKVEKVLPEKQWIYLPWPNAVQESIPVIILTASKKPPLLSLDCVDLL